MSSDKEVLTEEKILLNSFEEILAKYFTNDEVYNQYCCNVYSLMFS